MANLKLVPVEMLQIVPYFNGDRKLLSFFLKKCEFVYNLYKGDETQNIYVIHALTSRLTDKAAAMVNDRDDLNTMEKLKKFLILHFDNYLYENFVAAELKHLKMKFSETYPDFCHRIRSALYVLLSEVNEIDDKIMRKYKFDIYNKMAINVFLNNLQPEIVKIIRLRGPGTLEETLGMLVLEETLLQEHYTFHNKNNTLKYGINVSSNLSTGFRFGTTSVSSAVSSSSSGFGGNARPQLPLVAPKPKPSLTSNLSTGSDSCSAFGTTSVSSAVSSSSSTFGITAQPQFLVAAPKLGSTQISNVSTGSDSSSMFGTTSVSSAVSSSSSTFGITAQPQHLLAAPKLGSTVTGNVSTGSDSSSAFGTISVSSAVSSSSSTFGITAQPQHLLEAPNSGSTLTSNLSTGSDSSSIFGTTSVSSAISSSSSTFGVPS